MSVFRILGVISVVLGLVLLIFAWNSIHTIPDILSIITTGRFTGSTMGYLLTSIVMLIGGSSLWIGGRPKP